MADEKKPTPDTDAEARQAIGAIDSQIESRKNSAGFSWDNAIGYGVGAGVTGYLSQMTGNQLARTAVVKGILEDDGARRLYNRLSDTQKREMVLESAKESKLAHSMIKNPHAWTIGVTAISVGAVLAWELWQQSQRAAQAKQDVAQLETIKKSWVDRTAEPAAASLEKGIISK